MEIIHVTRNVHEKYCNLQRNTDNTEIILQASVITLVSPLQKTVVENIKQLMWLPIKKIKKKSNKYRNRLDTMYGVRPDGKGNTLIGDSAVKFTRSKVIIVKDQTLQVTSTRNV